MVCTTGNVVLHSGIPHRQRMLDKSVGTNKDRKAIQKALKKAITITCYPYNLSVAGAATKVKSKTSGKLMPSWRGFF